MVVFLVMGDLMKWVIKVYKVSLIVRIDDKGEFFFFVEVMNGIFFEIFLYLYKG